MNYNLLVVLVLFGCSFISFSEVLVYNLQGKSYDSEQFQQFGTQLIMFGHRALVTGTGTTSTPNISSNGVVFLYTRPSSIPFWSRVGMLSPSPEDPSPSDLYYGADIDMNEHFIVIGVTRQTNSSYTGSVEVFDLTLNKLQVIEPEEVSANFGYSLAVGGSSLVVGAPNDDLINGVVYFYSLADNDTWVFDSSFSLPGYFGKTIAMNVRGTTTLVASETSDGRGFVTVFMNMKGTWIYSSTLRSAPDDVNFGKTIEIYENLALISAEARNGDGVVYIYTYDETWVETGVLRDFGPQFGKSLAMASDRIFIVGSGDDNSYGSATLFVDYDGWKKAKDIVPEFGFVGDQFGSSIGIEDDVVMIGGKARVGSEAFHTVYSGFVRCLDDNALPHCQYVPSNWTCDPSYYNDHSTCHCDCGIKDPDCGVHSCVPLNWRCSQSWWLDGSCDCSCGVPDPDCTKPSECVVPHLWKCEEAFYGDGICDCECGSIDPDCTKLEKRCPPKNWTCTLTEYNDLDCNCNCGAPDPSCPADFCEFWKCDGRLWSDGHCDCECGIPDPDCSSTACEDMLPFILGVIVPLALSMVFLVIVILIVVRCCLIAHPAPLSPQSVLNDLNSRPSSSSPFSTHSRFSELATEALTSVITTVKSKFNPYESVQELEVPPPVYPPPPYSAPPPPTTSQIFLTTTPIFEAPSPPQAPYLEEVVNFVPPPGDLPPSFPYGNPTAPPVEMENSQFF